MGNADTAITGNITADPELKYSNNGNARLAFSVASERRYQVNGEWTGDTSFFNVVAWRKTAEDAAGILENSYWSTTMRPVLEEVAYRHQRLAHPVQ